MSSLFISNCFIKTATATENSISSTAIYRTTVGNFRKLLFKGFFNKDENIINFNEKSLIVLIGRFTLEDSTEYVIKNYINIF